MQQKMFTMEASTKLFSHKIEDLIRQGNNYKIKSYIKDMKPSELVDSHGTSLLHLAAKYDNYRLMKHLIEIKFNINAENASKTTPLIVAARFSSFKAADSLIQANANIYAINSSNKSALSLLLNNSYVPQYLIISCLEKVKSTSSSDDEIAEKLRVAECPFEYVIYLKNANVTRMIINRYGQNDVQQSYKALTLAIKEEDQENILALLQCEMEIDFSKIDAVLFFSSMLWWDYEDEPCLITIVDTFLKRVDWKSLRERDLPYFESIFRQGSKKFLELFLQHNVNEYVKNKFPSRDLWINIFGNCNVNTRELLKHRNVEVNSQNTDGQTALHMAVARENSLNDVRALIELGADPNSSDHIGRVPLALVYSNGSRDKVNFDSNEMKIIELLLLAGADIQIYMKSDFMWYKRCSLTRLELITAQLVIDESLKKPIEETIQRDIKNFRLMSKIHKVCCQHLEELKAMKVQGSISLYSILVTDSVKIACHLRDREVIEGIMLSEYMGKWHFYYVSKLKKSVKQILHVMDLREKAIARICEATGLPDSQYIVLEKILSFLTYRDLLVFDLL